MRERRWNRQKIYLRLSEDRRKRERRERGVIGLAAGFARREAFTNRARVRRRPAETRRRGKGGMAG